VCVCVCMCVPKCMSVFMCTYTYVHVPIWTQIQFTAGATRVNICNRRHPTVRLSCLQANLSKRNFSKVSF